jgi:hypothetical protein
VYVNFWRRLGGGRGKEKLFEHEQYPPRTVPTIPLYYIKSSWLMPFDVTNKTLNLLIFR